MRALDDSAPVAWCHKHAPHRRSWWRRFLRWIRSLLGRPLRYSFSSIEMRIDREVYEGVREIRHEEP